MKYIFGILLSILFSNNALTQSDTVQLDSLTLTLPEPLFLGSLMEFNEKPTIYYFPFYDDVQMIEIDYYNHSLAQGRHGDMVRPRGGSDYADALMRAVPNGILFRDRKGKILSSYYMSGTFKKSDLSSPEKCITRTHLSGFNSYKRFDAVGFGQSDLRKKSVEFGYAFKVFKDGGVGMIDTLGNFVLEPIYQRIEFVNSNYKVSLNGRWILFNSNFEPLMDKKYKRLDFIKDDLYIACESKCGCVNKNGDTIVDFKYDNISFFNMYPWPHMMFKKGKHYGLMDKDGQEVVPAKYLWIEPNGFGYYARVVDRKIGILNKEGVEITPFIFENHKPTRYQSGYYRVQIIDNDYKKKGFNSPVRSGLVAPDGTVLGKIKYDQVSDFIGGKAKVKLNGKFGLIDEKGKELTRFIYDEIRASRLEHIVVKKDGLFGLLNSKGKVIIPTKYQMVANPSDGLANVRNEDRKLGYINIEGGKNIPCIYDNTWRFIGGVAKVVLNRKTGLINKKGEELTGYQYHGINPLQWAVGYSLVQKGSKWGIINSKGEEVIPAIYDSYKGNSNNSLTFKSAEEEVVFKP